MTYKSKGQGKEAISFIERAIAITEKTLGTDHLNIAAFANNLADVYSITGKYKEAVALYYRAFQINKKALGPKHPEVCNSIFLMILFIFILFFRFLKILMLWE